MRLDDTLEVLRQYHIGFDDVPVQELPDVGRVTSSEVLYQISLSDVEDTAGLQSDALLSNGIYPDSSYEPNPNWTMLQDIATRRIKPAKDAVLEAPEPFCAWYCPIHYYGHGWGIYVRQNCWLNVALGIASKVDWPSIKGNSMSAQDIVRKLLISSFYAIFLHEQFHHKVESLALRFLVTTGTDRYRRYKKDVYRPTYMTPACLEESLANAESYLRLSERYYRSRLPPPFYEGLRTYLKWSFPQQPPGYRDALGFLTDTSFKSGQHRLQSLVLDGKMSPLTPASHWAVSPDVIRSLMNIEAEIYMIVPAGVAPLVQPSNISPGYTISTEVAAKGLIKHYGYRLVTGGKGSHIKLAKPDAPTIVLTGNQDALSPGVLKKALDSLGGFPLSQARDVFEGRT